MKIDARISTAVRLLVPGLRVAVVLLLVAVAAWSGLGDAGDRMLRGPYYRLRGDRDTKQHVILVALDAPTVAAWGPPPWKGDVLSKMFATIAAGKPRALGVVDDPARIGSFPNQVISGPVALVLDGGAVEAVHIGDATEPTATSRIAAAARVELEHGINYVGQRGLPTVSAIDVARGAIPQQTFAGKIVVVGLTAQPYAGLVPTPVGPLAAAQVQAHALASSADGATWGVAPGWLRWLVIGFAIALALVIARIPSRIATVASVLLAFSLLVFDYVLFATGAMVVGATLPLFALLATASVERIYERVVLQRHVREIAHWTRRWMLLESMRDHGPSDKPGYWRRVGELTRLYLGATSSIIAELPAAEHRLELRVLSNVESAQIKERRRDIRRSPYRKAHMTLGPVWHDDFVSEGRTLIVPLIVRNTQLIGFWMVTFERRSAVTASHMALIKTLAQEIGRALERGRSQQAPEAGRGLEFELEDVKRAFQAHGQNQQDLLTLGEAMPFGVFVSTLWGDVRYANSAMKRLCSQRGIDVASTDGDLAAMLSGLTGRGNGDVHAELRELVQSQELYLRGDRDDVALSWLGREDDGERLVVGWVLPGAAPAANVRAVDDQTATLLRKHSDLGIRNARGTRPPSSPPSSDDHALTVPHTKFDETLPPRGSSTTSGTIAHGTPTFNGDQPPRLDPNELFGFNSPLAPDATFKVRKPTADEVAEEEHTAVGNEPEPETETQKQPPRRPTMRLFNVKSDS
jgi:CHASE2 domain-containing sensor protein